MNKDFLLGLEGRLGDALEGLASQLDTSTMQWAARLFDPVNGAFYYSNSGRDYEGFGPDIESTAQLLRVVETLGMTDKFGSLGEALPRDITDKLLGFVNSLLDEDGYFYHPQWGKGIGITRRGRDLNSARKIYKMLGAQAPRPTAIEMIEGKRAADADALPEHLKSKKAFYAYLDGLDVRNHSYAVGNNINSQLEQIRAAGLEREVCNWLDSMQNPDNGLWADELSYRSISGYINLSSAYVFSGRKINYTDKISESLLSVLSSDVTPEYIVYVHNPISAIGQSISLMKNVGDTYAAARLQNEIMQNAPEIIDVTTKKLQLFRKPDGSFSYTLRYSAHRSQNVPVALYEEEEGDANATSIAASRIISGLFATIGIQCKIFDEYDFRDFVNTVRAQKPIVKRKAPEGRIV